MLPSRQGSSTVIYTVIVNGKRWDDWIVHYNEWRGLTHSPVPKTIIDQWEGEDGDLRAEIQLEEQTYRICGQVVLSTSIELDMEPRPKIIAPTGAEWPLKIESNQTQTVECYFFKAGDNE